MFRIGNFFILSQVLVKALRFYDEVGLLKPTYVDRDITTTIRLHTPAAAQP